MERMREALKRKSARERKALFARMEKWAEAKDLRIGDKKIPFAHVPLLVLEKTKEKALTKVERVIEALILLERHALKNEHLHQRLMNSLTEGGRELVRHCQYESDFSLQRRHRRVDALLDFQNDNLGLIEINQAAPLAIHFHDTCQEMAAMLMEEVASDFTGDWYPHYLYPKLLQWFVDEWQERKGKGHFPRVIALPIEHGYPPKFTDLPGMAKRLEGEAQMRFGEKLEVVVCFPYEISLQAGIPYVQGRPIDLIWRNSVYMQKYKDEGLPLHDYLHILNHHQDFLILNSTRTWLSRTKETFSLFWHDALLADAGCSVDLIRDLKKIIPETHNLFYEDAAYWRERLMKEKDQWITKPADAGFGQGVEFGTHHDALAWARLIEERRHGGFVFQKRIKYPETRILDIAENGDLLELEVDYDFCPHHVNGEFTGSALVRANVKKEVVAKMNLVAGGMSVPLLTGKGQLGN